jgi:gluconolactonase
MKIFLISSILLLASAAFAQESRDLAVGQPDAVADLRSTAGAALAGATWKFREAQLVKTDFKTPGASASDPLPLYPTGKTISTFRLEPKAGVANFDDGAWEILDPNSFEQRRGNGLLSFVWYRLNLTLPEKIGVVDVKGAAVVFEIVVDDYAEVWVNGKQNRPFGSSGGGAIKGYNARQRVFLTADAKPGEQFQIAVLAANGPFGDLPDNYIWVRSATLDFYKKYPSNPEWANLSKTTAFDEELKQVLGADASVEKLAEGFQFTEGPVWHPDGFLLFSDPNANVIYRYDPLSRNVSIYKTKSGYSGADIGEYHQPGSNGLAIDAQGRLIACEHGNRRVVRHEIKGPVTVLADKHNGLKFNSPNDLVLKSDGTVFFTDPPYGLPKNYTDPRKETPHQGIYRVKNGVVELLNAQLGGPNGLAFSPDEKFLYVGNWDIRDIWRTKTVWRFPVNADGSLGEGKVFFDFNQTPEDEAIDGIKVDDQGYVFVSAPGGLWILNPAGKLLGKISGPERPANMAWGDADGKALYLTAHTGLYKIRTLNGGKIAQKAVAGNSK